MQLLLLQEFIKPNLKRLALELQSMLIEAELEEFNCVLEGVTLDSKLIAVKLVIDQAPDTAVNRFNGRRFSWTGHEHVIEFYDGPTVDLGRDSVASISGNWYHKLNAGVYLFADDNLPNQSLMLERAKNGTAKSLVAFEVGFDQNAIKAFAKQYIDNWGQ